MPNETAEHLPQDTVKQSASLSSTAPADTGQPLRISQGETAQEARFEVISSIRDNIVKLPRERQEEIFEDFLQAAQKKNLGYLADTVLNWALGGHGYDYAPEPVTRLDPIATDRDSAEDKAVWEEMWSGGGE